MKRKKATQPQKNSRSSVTKKSTPNKTKKDLDISALKSKVNRVYLAIFIPFLFIIYVLFPVLLGTSLWPLFFVFFIVFLILVPIYLLKIYPIRMKNLVITVAIWEAILIIVYEASRYQYLKNVTDCNNIVSEPGVFSDCWPLNPFMYTLAPLPLISGAVFLTALFTLPKKIHPKYTIAYYLTSTLIVLSYWILAKGYYASTGLF